MDRAEGALRIAEQALSEARGTLRAIASIRVDDSGALLVLAPDGEWLTLGCVRGRDGHDAPSIVDASVKDGRLNLSNSDGSVLDAGVVMGPRGAQGERGERGLPGQDAYPGEVRGLYDPTAQYRYMDVVSLNGSEWRAKVDNPGPLEQADGRIGSDWTMSASRGKRGDKGKDGEPGKPGKDGKAGPSIVDWVQQGYDAIPVMSDGSVGPPLNVRAFFELYHSESS